MLVQGVCVKRRIAALHGLVDTSLRRHEARHLPEAMIEAARAKVGDFGKTLLSRVDKMVTRLEGLADRCDDYGTGEQLLAVAKDLRPYHELLGRVSGEIANDKVTALFVNLGVRTEDELRNRVALSRGGEDLSPGDAQEEAVATLEIVWRKHPELRHIAMQRLERSSYALVEHTNGTNGGSHAEEADR